MLQYTYTILYVKDVAQTIKFYQQAFGFEQKFITPEKDYGEIQSGATTIAFANLELANSNLKNGFIASSVTKQPFGIELGFVTEKIEEAIEKAIKNGAIVVEKMTTKPWGQKVAYVRDNNGFLIELCTPIKS